MSEQLKYVPDAENEIHDLAGFKDLGQNVMTPVATFEPAVALGVVQTLARVVSAGHASRRATTMSDGGIVRAQLFEEGAVYMTAPPFDGFAADRYLMDFYDVTERDICSRMHMHIGMRFVRMMTGPGTVIRVSALSPLIVSEAEHFAVDIRQFGDHLDDPAGGPPIPRYNAVVPECSWVDLQIPRGTSHQFNAIGPHAVIDTIHPEESIEIFREHASRINMMAQTIFLEEEQPPSEACSVLPDGDLTDGLR